MPTEGKLTKEQAAELIAENIAYSLEENIAVARDFIINEMIMESLLKNGEVSIQEAKLFGELVNEILQESVPAFLPESEDIEGGMPPSDPGEGITLVDPATGDQYTYFPSTGELVAANAGVPDAGVPAPVAESTEINENVALVEKLLQTLES